MSKIVAVTACPTGIAHTIMAAEALQQAAARTGHSMQVETQGSAGTRNTLAEADIQVQAGRGGRNQHLALAAALELERRGLHDAHLLAAGTDGIDGSSSDAGALVDVETCQRGRDAGCDPTDSLARADSGTFLEAAGDLLHTGPTLTNVGDLVLGLRLGGCG